MFSRFGLSLVIALNLLASQGSAARVQQSPSTKDDGWTTLTIGQSVYGIRYDQFGAIVVNNDSVMSCVPDAPGSEAGLYVSRPSPLKKFALVVCSKFGGDEAFVIDTAHNRVASRDVVPKHWQIINWISWSPDERFALVAADGEEPMGDMAFVDLGTGEMREIHFKDLTNPRADKHDRLQDFDPDAIVWPTASSFQIRLNIRCNPYEGGDACDYKKVLASHAVRVNLKPFTISYGAAGQSRNTGTARVATRNSQGSTGIRSIDFRNFTFHPAMCSQSFGVGNPARVRNGRFANRVSKFYVQDVMYGDLTADGHEEAVIYVGCEPIPNMNNYGAEIFIYTTRNGLVTLLAEINDEDMARDYKRYYPEGILWSITEKGIKTEQGLLKIENTADGPHCCPEHFSTLEYRWNGQNFVLIGEPKLRPFK